MAIKGRASSRARLRASDIKDVEAGLASARRDQIALGERCLSERPAEQIFFLDRQGIADQVSRRELRDRGLLAKRPLCIDEILRPSSQVPPQERPRTRARTGLEGERRLVERKARAIQRGTGKGPDQSKELVGDIWAMEETSADRKAGGRARKTGVLRAARDKAVSRLPLPGLSYRPTPSDLHQLLEEISSAEVERLERERKMRERLPPPVLLTGHAGTSAMDLAVREILSGAQPRADSASDTDAGAQADPGADGTPEGGRPKTPGGPRKKTKRERAKEARRKEGRARQQQLAQEQRIQRQLDSLKAIARQVRQEARAKVQSEQGSGGNKSNPATDSRQPPKVEMPLAFNLPEEVPSSLRMLRPRGNLVLERFRRLQHGLLVRRAGRAGSKRGRRRMLTKLVDRR